MNLQKSDPPSDYNRNARKKYKNQPSLDSEKQNQEDCGRASIPREGTPGGGVPGSLSQVSPQGRPQWHGGVLTEVAHSHPVSLPSRPEEPRQAVAVGRTVGGTSEESQRGPTPFLGRNLHKHQPNF